MFYLLLLYSFLPGMAKILDFSFLFSLNIPIIIYFFYGIKLTKYETYVVFLLMAVFVFSTIQSVLFNDLFSVYSFLSSFYVWIFPMVGFFLYKKYSLIEFLRAIVNVVFFHVIIGFVTYGFFMLPSFLQHYADILRDGVGWYRMSSVAGSLIFGVITSCAFNIQIYLISQKHNNGYILSFIKLVVILLGSLLSLQRSSWMAIIPSVIIYLVFNKNSITVFLLVFVPIISAVTSFVLNNDFYYDRFLSLFSSDFSPVDERYQIWLNGLYYFNSNFLGQGIGQVGQFAYKNNIPIPYYITDGDYFKILAEGGFFISLIYVALVILICYRLMCSNALKSDLLLLCAVLGFFIQMIGSNISEFYFANYLFWALMGYFIFWKRRNDISSDSDV